MKAPTWAREKSPHTEVNGSHLYGLPKYDACIKYSYLIIETGLEYRLGSN